MGRPGTGSCTPLYNVVHTVYNAEHTTITCGVSCPTQPKQRWWHYMQRRPSFSRQSCLLPLSWHQFQSQAQPGTQTDLCPGSCAFTALKQANCPSAACFSTGRLSSAKLPLQNRATQRTSLRASWKSKWRPWQATSWPVGPELLDQRQTSDTSQQVRCIPNSRSA